MASKRERTLTAAVTTVVIGFILIGLGFVPPPPVPANIDMMEQLSLAQQAEKVSPPFLVENTEPPAPSAIKLQAVQEVAQPSAPPEPERVAPLEGEGMIHLVKRVCGHADNWYPNATANHITPPMYVVPDTALLQINCTLPAQAPPVPVAPGPVAGQEALAASVPTAVGGSGWSHPIGGRCYTSSFGWRNGKIHNGDDFPAPVGTDVFAAAAGVAHRGEDPDGAGWYIMIDHGGGVWTAYFHLSDRLVANDEQVAAGQHIAESGGADGAAGAGNSTGPHLHFEVHPWGEWVKRWSDALGASAYINPVSFMADRGVTFSHC